jgi:ribonuclease HII
MALWAGIDEAGYGPQLGPLVVAGTAFKIEGTPAAGTLWEALGEAVARHARGSAGRLVVNDSKKVYSGPHTLRRLEEGVLAFLPPCTGGLPAQAGELLAMLGACRRRGEEPSPWFRAVSRTALPVVSNLSALESKAALLSEALAQTGVRVLPARAAVVLPPEFNRTVARTRSKSLLLFQKCGLILQHLWRQAGPGRSHIVVDKHGARVRYRRLLKDVFPDCQCDILREGRKRSTYRIMDGERTLNLTFAEGADAKALPVALASMTAKYLRELHMIAFNSYWHERVEGLRPTAGYRSDSARFLKDISDAMHAEGVHERDLARCK